MGVNQRRSVGTFALVALIITIFPAVGHANKFKYQDSQEIMAIVKRIITAERDNLDTQRVLNSQYSFEARDCLNEANQQLDVIPAMLSTVSTLVFLSSVMDLPSDEAAVIQSLNIEVNTGLKSLSFARTSVNHNAGACGSSAIVSTRAQAALSMLADVERILLGLGQRR